ncbi:MAG: GNAT family N-acetyltransferase [Halanaeroarchaeum sp.]
MSEGVLMVRPAVAADAEPIATLHAASIRELASDAYDPAVIEAWASGKDPGEYPVDESGHHLIVAEVDGTLAGFGELVVEADDYLEAEVAGEIRAVYVDPAFAREGVGQRLYEDLEAAARERGLDSVGLWASLNAVPFYEAQGFERVASVTHEFGGDVPGPAVEMRKRLD